MKHTLFLKNSFMQITLKNLPKHSLNEIYAGKHYRVRKKDKDNYYKIIKSQFKGVLGKENQYDVKYLFEFKTRPLDSSNTAYMLKMIEDVIFEDDSFKIVQEISTKSQKGKEDKVTITIKQLN